MVPTPRGSIATPAKVDAKACTPPDYPAGARRLGHDGLTVLDMLIGADGLVKEAKVRTTSGHPQLDGAALSALSLCRFTPGTVDGKPVEGWNAIQYRWKLR